MTDVDGRSQETGRIGEDAIAREDAVDQQRRESDALALEIGDRRSSRHRRNNRPERSAGDATGIGRWDRRAHAAAARLLAQRSAGDTSLTSAVLP